MTHLHNLLSAIRARADAATPGPWQETTGRDCSLWVVRPGQRMPIAELPETHGISYAQVSMPPRQRLMNGCFIASARTDVPRLVRAIEVMAEDNGPIECPCCGATTAAHHEDCTYKDDCPAESELLEWRHRTLDLVARILAGEDE